MGYFEEQYASAQEEAAITNAFQKEQVLMAAFLHRDYCRKNVEEYFAEVFRAYLLGMCRRGSLSSESRQRKGSCCMSVFSPAALNAVSGQESAGSPGWRTDHL